MNNSAFDQTEKVILRRWRAHPRTALALFPERPEGCNRVAGYEHVGGYGAADYKGCLRRTRPLPESDPDAQELLDELRGRGYTFVVVRRRQT